MRGLWAGRGRGKGGNRGVRKETGGLGVKLGRLGVGPGESGREGEVRITLMAE